MFPNKTKQGCNTHGRKNTHFDFLPCHTKAKVSDANQFVSWKGILMQLSSCPIAVRLLSLAGFGRKYDVTEMATGSHFQESLPMNTWTAWWNPPHSRKTVPNLSVDLTTATFNNRLIDSRNLFRLAFVLAAFLASATVFSGSKGQ